MTTLSNDLGDLYRQAIQIADQSTSTISLLAVELPIDPKKPLPIAIPVHSVAKPITLDIQSVNPLTKKAKVELRPPALNREQPIFYFRSDGTVRPNSKNLDWFDNVVTTVNRNGLLIPFHLFIWSRTPKSMSRSDWSKWLKLAEKSGPAFRSNPSFQLADVKNSSHALLTFVFRSIVNQECLAKTEILDATMYPLWDAALLAFKTSLKNESNQEKQRMLDAFALSNFEHGRSIATSDLEANDWWSKLRPQGRAILRYLWEREGKEVPIDELRALRGVARCGTNSDSFEKAIRRITTATCLNITVSQKNGTVLLHTRSLGEDR